MRSQIESRDNNFVPTVDLSKLRMKTRDNLFDLASTVDLACRRSGFFIITGHGISHVLTNELLEVATQFFSQGDDEKRCCVADGKRGGMRGLFRRPSYVAASGDKETPPDLCEVFIVNRLGEPGVAATANLVGAHEKWSSPNLWPSHPDIFRSAVLRYYRAMEDLSRTLLRLFSVAHGLEDDWFAQRSDQHISNLCLNWYPPLSSSPAPGQLRKGEHTDWGTFTILFQDGVAGLQIQTRDGYWIDVPHVENGLIINIGDLMARWTNGRWASTKHRVVLPDDRRATQHRLSAAFFHTPNWTAVVEPLIARLGEESNFASVTAGEYLSEKLRSTRQPPSARNLVKVP